MDTPNTPPSSNPTPEIPPPGGRVPLEPPVMAPPPPPPYGPTLYPMPPQPAPAPARTGIATRILTGLVTSLLLASLALNLWLGLYFVSSMENGPVERVHEEGDPKQRIVILPIEGVINDQMSDQLQENLRRLRQHKPVAIVLRVDSPGGGVSASDRIWHYLQQYRQESGVPVVASFGSIAASGGYYVAASADHIIAEPTAITGSIGVLAEGFTLDRLLDKIGVTPQVHHSTPADRKDSLSMTRPWTSQDVSLLVGILDAAHDRFVSRVAEGRKSKNLTAQLIREKKIDSGAPFTVQEAIALNLVDAEGFLEDAIDKARELAGLPANAQPRVTIIGPRPSLFSLLGASNQTPPTQALNGQGIRQMINEMGTPRLEYRFAPGR